MTIDADSRILFFAPHPDDETLAGGGLLQKAAAAGAMVHVVFATSGDNNPWPHRLLERRWTIGPLDRALWGKRRAQEAINALATLGIPSSCSQFLQLPDQRLTELLLHANADAVAKIRSAIEQTRPRLVFAPSLFDLHPDHSALHILVRRAMADAEANETQLLCYCVHEPPEVPARPQIGINLSPAQQQRKRRAILCHRTQMALSRRRFLAHARCSEFFWPAATGRYGPETHPVRTVELAGDILVATLQRARPARGFAPWRLLLAWEKQPAHCCIIPLRRNTGRVPIEDAKTRRPRGFAQFNVRRGEARVEIPLRFLPSSAPFFIKLEQPSIFFDAAGWRAIPAILPEPASTTATGTPARSELVAAVA